MAHPPIVTATIQTAIINALSAVLAQFITAQQNHKPFTLSPLPILQFFLFGLISTPPNFLWQDFLESTFPAYHRREDEGGKPEKKKEEAPRLNKRNTLAKALLDQTVGAAANTLLYSCFMHSAHMATAQYSEQQHQQPPLLSSLMSNPWGVVRYADVDWAAVWQRARGELWPLLAAGWRFWPLVSVVNYVFLTSVEARNLVGSLAGLGWGVYLSLAAAK